MQEDEVFSLVDRYRCIILLYLEPNILFPEALNATGPPLLIRKASLGQVVRIFHNLFGVARGSTFLKLTRRTLQQNEQSAQLAKTLRGE